MLSPLTSRATCKLACEGIPNRCIPMDSFMSIREQFAAWYYKRRAEVGYARDLPKILTKGRLLQELKLPKLQANRFRRITFLGKGSTATVELVEDTHTNKRQCALKTMNLKGLYKSSYKDGYVSIIVEDRDGEPNHMPRIRWSRRRNNKSRKRYRELKRDAKKFLSDSISSNLEGLKTEIHILNELRECEYVVDFYDSVLDPISKNVLICTEYCDVSLDCFMGEKRMLGFEELQVISTCILLGLREIHRLGYAHLDVKPHNILLKKNGKVKLCDFGSAVKIGDLPVSLTVGTTVFASPELHFSLFNQTGCFSSDTVFDGMNVDENAFTNSPEQIVKSDVWALGITMLLLSIGKSNFFSFKKSNLDGWDSVLEELISSISSQNGVGTDNTTFLQYMKQHHSNNIIEELRMYPNMGTDFVDFLEKALVIKRSARATVDELIGSIFIDSRENAGDFLCLS